MTILAGKNTGRLGVEPTAHPAAVGTNVTNLERTLIDVTVRPMYAGGIHHVLEVFKAAREQISAPALACRVQATHADSLEPLRSRVSQFKFHLAHGTKNPLYDDDWKLFFPNDL